jgi:hypothetical protein
LVPPLLRLQLPPPLQQPPLLPPGTEPTTSLNALIIPLSLLRFALNEKLDDLR